MPELTEAHKAELERVHAWWPTLDEATRKVLLFIIENDHKGITVYEGPR